VVELARPIQPAQWEQRVRAGRLSPGVRIDRRRTGRGAQPDRAAGRADKFAVARVAPRRVLQGVIIWLCRCSAHCSQSTYGKPKKAVITDNSSTRSERAASAFCSPLVHVVRWAVRQTYRSRCAWSVCWRMEEAARGRPTECSALARSLRLHVIQRSWQGACCSDVVLPPSPLVGTAWQD
jgi:hypothetical protein